MALRVAPCSAPCGHALKFNELVASGAVRAPIVIGRDHLDGGSVASPNRETEAMLDGSDAIAGVINIVLKSGTDNIASSITGATFSEGDGETFQYNANYGFKIGRNGFFNITGEYLRRLQTNRTQNHELVIFDQSSQGRFFAYFGDPAAEAFDDSVLAARGLTRDDFNFRIGDAQVENGGVFFNTMIPLNSGAEF